MLCARKHSVRTALLLVQLVLHISIGLKPYLPDPKRTCTICPLFNDRAAENILCCAPGMTFRTTDINEQVSVNRLTLHLESYLQSLKCDMKIVMQKVMNAKLI